jgi:hypothetical protein
VPESDKAGRPRDNEDGELLHVRDELSEGREGWISGDKGGVGAAGCGDVNLRDLVLEALLLLRDSPGSFRKTHSRPLDVHLAHGYCRSHLIFESAQACQYIILFNKIISGGNAQTYFTGFLSRAVKNSVKQPVNVKHHAM